MMNNSAFQNLMDSLQGNLLNVLIIYCISQLSGMYMISQEWYLWVHPGSEMI